MAQKILVVEDNPDISELLSIYLSRGGYETLRADSSAEGITKAGAERPDLILMDLLLPDMSAVEATLLLKQDPVTSQIPIVVLTAMPGNTWKAKALQAGVADYLVKPVSPVALLEVIRKLLETPSVFTER